MIDSLLSSSKICIVRVVVGFFRSDPFDVADNFVVCVVLDALDVSDKDFVSLFSSSSSYDFELREVFDFVDFISDASDATDVAE